MLWLQVRCVPVKHYRLCCGETHFASSDFLPFATALPWAEPPGPDILPRVRGFEGHRGHQDGLPAPPAPPQPLPPHKKGAIV